jgi:hypothetical protein
VGAGGEPVDSVAGELVAVVVAGGHVGRRAGKDRPWGACKAKARVDARAFWTIAVIDGS